MKIAIVTNFQDFNPGYSLVTIVFDQIAMFSRYGHEVHLFVCERYNPGYDKNMDCIVHKCVPFGHLTDYKTGEKLTEDDSELARKTKEVLQDKFEDLEIEFVITHDWIFTGWNRPYALALKQLTPLMPEIRWLHWVHSVPSAMSDWWNIREYGPAHKIAFPNQSDKLRVAEQFRGELNDVRVIPHIVDLRTIMEFRKDTCQFIDDNPGVMQATMVQVYPASSDRLSAKGLDAVISIFGGFKKRGFSVCLVCANQWARGVGRPESMKTHYDLAAKYNLKAGEEFIFTSDYNPEYEAGLPRKMLLELQMCANLFIFPTREESFGLVGPEAALMGNFLAVNHNLAVMLEIYHNAAVSFDFGSFHQEVKHKDPAAFYDMVSTILIGRTYQNEAVRVKTLVRKLYNMDYIYLNYYEPIMGESSLWVETS
jgi:hypothetical protein